MLAALLFAVPAAATPPEYRSFDREQAIAPADLAPATEWLEIWVLNVGQGDALLIRLPESMNYDRNGVSERIDVVVDGGPGLKLRQILRQLYPAETIIEHAVLTHHDSDHVTGLTKLLADDRFGIDNLYHNGLASWERGVQGFPAAGVSPSSGRVFLANRGLALVADDDETLQAQHLLDGLTALNAAVGNTELQGVYRDFAEAIAAKTTPQPLGEFRHSLRGEDFISELDDRIAAEIFFEVLWPEAPQRRFGNWGYTINGNSLTFRLDYGEFSMLFSGDHNEVSEADWLADLDGEVAELVSDVLKIPHHGSKHNDEAFFAAVDPVIGVASMGSLGFRPGWKHPSEEVIRWMGGPHRVYSTFIHERRFRWEDLATETARGAFFESTHVLIQTDGRWFRVVEVTDPATIPDVRDVDRGDGTRWIRATE